MYILLELYRWHTVVYVFLWMYNWGRPPGREGEKIRLPPQGQAHREKNANLPSQATFSLPGNLLKLFYEIV